MSFTPIARAVALATVGTSLMIPALAQAGFVEDSKASMELRNFYYNSDVRDDAATQAKQEEWAQGFIVKATSGYTEGTIGFGVDAIGTLGVKLDSGRGTTGTALLQRDKETGEAQDTYGDLGVTAKFKAAKSVVKLGTLMPNLPTVSGVDNRLLPTMFQGGQLTSTDIENMTLDVGQINRINYRDSSDQETMTLAATSAFNGVKGGKISAGLGDSEELNFFGASYKWNPSLTTSYNAAVLDELYKQHIFNVVHTLPIAEGQSLKTDVRYAVTNDDSNSGVDNKAFGAMLTYTLGANKLAAAYQSMSGDTGYAFINGNNPFLVNYVTIRDFANTDEKSWQLRYDYDFASVGVPGLTFMTRYISGDNFDINAAGDEGKEWERNVELKYAVQGGSLKGFGVHWRNATTRTNFAKGDIDQNRLILSYTLPLL